MIKNEFYNKTREYALGRPTYPDEIINKLYELGIDKNSVIADIGAGTGLLTLLLTKLECAILAVEPNEEMINECKKYCVGYSDIEFINASAEQTQIKENYLDAIFIAQAFHWFDKGLAKVEFKRILKANGYVIFLWNDIDIKNEFEKEYIKILNDFKVKTPAAISSFDPDQDKLNFLGQKYEKIYYNNQQVLDADGLIANATSLSYTPSKNSFNYEAFKQALFKLFRRHQKDGKVTLHYKTEMCIGLFLN